MLISRPFDCVRAGFSGVHSPPDQEGPGIGRRVLQPVKAVRGVSPLDIFCFPSLGESSTRASQRRWRTSRKISGLDDDWTVFRLARKCSRAETFSRENGLGDFDDRALTRSWMLSISHLHLMADRSRSCT